MAGRRSRALPAGVRAVRLQRARVVDGHGPRDVFGLPRDVRGIHRARDLRNACDDYGAYLVICHPFRYFPGPSSLLFGHSRDQQPMPLEELAEHPVFSLADAIEVLNGGCIDRENTAGAGRRAPPREAADGGERRAHAARGRDAWRRCSRRTWRAKKRCSRNCGPGVFGRAAHYAGELRSRRRKKRSR